MTVQGEPLAVRAIARLMDSSARGERPDWRLRPYKILFLRHDRIGEMILSTGILRAIAESNPTIHLDVLASSLNAPVLRHEPYVREVLVLDRHSPMRYPGALMEVRRRRYDAVVDGMLTPPSSATALLMLASGARLRIGVGERGNVLYTLPVPPRETQEHMVDRFGALVTAFGLQPSGLDLAPRVHVTAAERERGERAWRGETEHRPRTGVRLLINVSARRSQHVWPDSRFVAAIRAAREHAPNAEIVIVSPANDRVRAAMIAAEGGARLVENDGIRDAMAIVARADVVFTPETSIAQVCSALGKPAVVLHARGNGAAWGPYRTQGRSVESLTGAVADISADQAIRALIRLLNEHSARSATLG